jgi:long-chain fatty acid transport protein
LEWRWLWQVLVLVLAAVLGGPQPSCGSGFALYEAGARATALGGAVVGRADDLSALFYNPAGITQLPSLQAMAGGTIIIPSTEIVTHPGGIKQHTHMKENVFFPPHLYLSYQVSKSIWLGLGVLSPFGLGVEFNAGWPGSINNIKTTVSTININPNIAVKITDYLSCAAGFDVMYFDLEMRRVLPLPLPTGFQDTTLKGDSFGYGFNLGLHFKPADFLAVGISYRSQIKEDVHGDVEFAPASPLNCDFQGSTILPDMIFTGVMIKPIKPLTLEVGFIWTHWGLFRQMVFNLENPLGTLIEQKNWRDAWRLQVGLEYKAADWLDLRAGYVFDGEPIRNGFADYIVPASDRHYFSFGPGFRWRQFTLDLSYTFMFMADKNINQSAALGFLPSEYKDRHAHLLGASLGVKF